MTARRLRVLIAEKRLTEAGIILRSICAGAGCALEVIYIEMKEELSEALKRHRPDVALLDLSLLQPDAVSEIRVLQLANQDVPFILFADPTDQECAVKCLSMGARDFLLEGYMDERTVARVLKFAVGANEEKSPQVTGKRENPEVKCNLQAILENRAGTQFQDREGEGAEQIMLEELMKVLKRNVRARDEVVPRRYGHIDLVLADASERCAAGIIQRLQVKLKAHKGELCREFANAVTVHAGCGPVSAQPLMKEICGCKATAEAFAVQLPLAVKVRA
jgi:DNA-binding response OmpR family regulator